MSKIKAPPELVERARLLYLATTESGEPKHTLAEIEVAVGRSISVISSWRDRQGWPRRRQAKRNGRRVNMVQRPRPNLPKAWHCLRCDRRGELPIPCACGYTPAWGMP